MRLLCRASSRRIVAAGLTASDAHITKRKSRTAARPAEDVVIVCAGRRNRPLNIEERNIRDDDSVGGSSGWASVQVILLDIDAVLADPGHGDVAVDDVVDLPSCEYRVICQGEETTYCSSGAGVSLDACPVLAVGDDRVGERHAVNDIVALATDGSNAQPVSANAGHTCDEDVRPARHRHAIVLVRDVRVLKYEIICG